jgi:uncharacterized repeat protein (TIGR03833 family)
MTRNTRVRESGLSGPQRDSLRVGVTVDIIQKEDQRSGRRTRGVVDEILTRSASHPHGIKVRLKGGLVGRVAAVIPDAEEKGK